MTIGTALLIANVMVLAVPGAAQGPGPVGLQNSRHAIHATPPLSTTATDSARGTHWREGASIGVATGAGYYLLLALAFGGGCNRDNCGFQAKGLLTISVIGALIGAAIGSLLR